jgi:hypothetical protein
VPHGSARSVVVGEQPQETPLRAILDPDVVVLLSDAGLSSSGYRRPLAYGRRSGPRVRQLYPISQLPTRIRAWQRSLIWRGASAGSGRTTWCCACCSSAQRATRFARPVETGPSLRRHDVAAARTRALQTQASQQRPISYVRLPAAESAQQTGQQVLGAQPSPPHRAGYAVPAKPGG